MIKKVRSEFIHACTPLYIPNIIITHIYIYVRMAVDLILDLILEVVLG